MLDITGKVNKRDIQIQEKCMFLHHHNTNNIYVNYSIECFDIKHDNNDTIMLQLVDNTNFYQKLNFEKNKNNELINNFWLLLSNSTQQTLYTLKDIIDENQDKITIK